MFIMSLAVADLIVGLIVMPISSLDFIAASGQGRTQWMAQYSFQISNIYYFLLREYWDQENILYEFCLFISYIIIER